MARQFGSSFGVLALCAASMFECSLDERTLSQQPLACADVMCGGSGETASGGSTPSSGGSSVSSGGRASGGHGGRPATGQGGGIAESGAAGGGGTSAGSAGEGAGNAINCPDLDENTVPDCTETSAQNSTFDVNIDGWRVETNTMAHWDFLNAQPGEHSGAILVENRAPAAPTSGEAFVYTGVTQCVSLAGASTDHEIRAQMFSEGDVVAGYGSVAGRLFASGDCTGTPLSITFSPNQGNTAIWLLLQTTVKADPSAMSLLVELRVGKIATRTDAVSLRFDNVLVR